MTSAPTFTSPRSLVTRALRRIGIVGETEIPSDAQMQQGFEILCEMLGTWRTKPHIAHGLRRLVVDNIRIHAPTGDRPHIVVTDHADITGPYVVQFPLQPVWLDGISWLESDTRDRPLQQIPTSDWVGSRDQADLAAQSGVTLRTVDRGTPSRYFLDGDFQEDAEGRRISINRLYLVPAPGDTVAFSLAFYVRRNMLRFEHVDDEISAPAGYPKAMRMNLAMELAGEYGKPVDRDLRNSAKSSLRDVKTVNEARRDVVQMEQIAPASRKRRRWL